jgi:two-component system CheB/CheR fusion protein
VELDERPFELRAALGSVLSTLELAARKKGIHLVYEQDPALPPLVSGDEGRLRQILANLVSNAVKFTNHGRVEVALAPAGEAHGPAAPGRVRLLCSVRDTGIGIPPENLCTIFDAFSRATRSTHAQFGGTGLGLSIAKQLVELMGGRIWAESEPNSGSLFRFTADLALTDETRGTLSAPAGSPQPPVESCGALRVLVAEDNRFNQLFVRDVLERLGHEVAVASDGEEALQILSRGRFDVVLMDVQMPKMDGDEATRRIRAGRVEGCARDVPVVALTAHAIQGDRERFLAAGMDDYLSKPFDPESLERVLGRAVERGRRACLPGDAPSALPRPAKPTRRSPQPPPQGPRLRPPDAGPVTDIGTPPSSRSSPLRPRRTPRCLPG